jgi:tetratricopeptide (TPR) repeat protein
MLRLLGLVPGPDFSVQSAAALAGIDIGEAAELLDALVSAHLVEPREPDRFGLHDLLRDFAVERVAEQEPDVACREAARRLFEQLADGVEVAAQVAFPSTPVLLRAAQAPADPRLRDRSAALAWLDTELANLVAVACSAATAGSPDIAPRLADSLRYYFWFRRDYVNWSATALAGLAAATASGDPRGQAASALSLGMSELNVSRYREAIGYLRQAMLISRSVTWREAEASALGNLGIAHSELDEFAQAIECYRRALVLNDELGRTTGRANNLGNLGLLQARTGEFRRCRRTPRRGGRDSPWAGRAGPGPGRRHHDQPARWRRRPRGPPRRGGRPGGPILWRVRLGDRHDRPGIGQPQPRQSPVGPRPGDDRGDAGRAVDLEGGALEVLARAHLAHGDAGAALAHATRSAAIHGETGHRVAQERALAVASLATKLPEPTPAAGDHEPATQGRPHRTSETATELNVGLI